MNELDKIKKAQTELTKRIDAYEAGQVDEFPKDGERVWFLYNDGAMIGRIWIGNEYQNGAQAQGNIFRTEADTERERDRRAVMQKLRMLAGDQSWIDWGDMSQKKYFICDLDGWCADDLCETFTPCTPYFQSQKETIAAIDTLGYELDVLRGV